MAYAAVTQRSGAPAKHRGGPLPGFSRCPTYCQEEDDERPFFLVLMVVREYAYRI
jgi:hypothetical protein